MKENVISIKDCLYIKDALGWNYLAYKKLNNIKSLCKDTQILDEVNKALNLFETHYDKLLEILEGNDN